ncbi:hypothetical protein LOTGIDRAFT_162179 [Lottia gigantea]|uniref:Glucuronosyltransferase n=1 Tax=Lottia gigantea TaxID=225164 RepID=V4BVT3_LOTGI|nr:hypothetical protein LOTGIDRAFT_162179 [Lottia gigantea]ESO93149.1 hypothetical protein LOTGIDRAFT_162179 [Lottia gigantea]
MYRPWIFLVILAVKVNNSHAGNFLLLPFPVTSHCLEMAGIAKELLQRNHSVFAYLPDTFKTSNCFDGSKVEIITYKPSEEFVKHKHTIETHIVEATFAGKQFTHNLTFLSAFFHIGAPMCESALIATDKMKLLKSKNIDIAIIDSMPTSECYFYVAKYLNAEAVIEGAAIFPGLGTAAQTHVHPFELSSFSSRMSLPERVMNTLLTLGVALGIRISHIFKKLDKAKLKDYVPDEVLDADVNEMMRKSLLFIENANDILDYPKALYPNHIRVGGLTTLTCVGMVRTILQD